MDRVLKFLIIVLNQWRSQGHIFGVQNRMLSGGMGVKGIWTLEQVGSD